MSFEALQRRALAGGRTVEQLATVAPPRLIHDGEYPSAAGPATFIRVQPEDHPTTAPVRPARSKIG